MAEEEVSYAAVVIKRKTEPKTEAQGEQTVYDEVKVHNKTIAPSDDTKDSAGILSEKEAGRRRIFQLMTYCLLTLCIISMLAIIGVIAIENQNLKKLIEVETKNLTEQIDELMTKKNNLTDQIEELKMKKNNLTNQIEELQVEKKNLTEQIEKMQASTIELNVSRAQWSIDAYCPKPGRTCVACQQGWTSPADKLLMSQSSCYAYNNAHPSNQLSWEEARGNCTGKISDLTVVADETEKTYVSSISYANPGITGYWIGLRAVAGIWKWINGSDMTNNTWINPPTNNSQCVISVKDQGWKPVNCDNKNAWICEKKALSL